MEIIKLNLIPSGVNPTCHCSQYDNGRVIRIELFDGLTPYTLQSGDTVTLNVRKPDNHIVTTTLTATQGNKYVDLVTTEQICACVGYNLCDLTITNGTKVIGTLNFIMQIERDVLADGIPSQSVIEDLDELVAEAVGDNYYTKNETNSLLDAKANKSNTYTKSEVDSALAQKANVSDLPDMTQYYTKTEVDEALALKADKSELYNMLPTDTASGAIANFPDGADNVPVKSLVANIEAIQAGSGDPSPSNVRAISGWSACNVTRTGKNLINISDLNVASQYIGSLFDLPSGNYTISCHIKNNTSVVGYFRVLKSDNTIVGSTTITANQNSDTNIQFSLTEKTSLKLYIYGSASGYNYDISNIQIEVGSTASAYEAYQADTKTINLGQTVYGGNLNVTTGKLSITHGNLDLGALNYTTRMFGTNSGFVSLNIPNAIAISGALGIANAKCSALKLVSNGGMARTDNNMFALGAYWSSGANLYIVATDYADDTALKTAMAGQILVYELATPIEVDLTPAEVKTLLGDNNIYCDTGDVAVTYKADIGLYIDKKLGGNVTRALNMTRVSMPTATPAVDEESNEEIEEPTESQDPEER